MDTRIQLRLANVARRLRSVRVGWSLAAVWLMASLCGWLMIVANRSGASTSLMQSLADNAVRERIMVWWLVASLLAAIVIIALARFRRPDYSQVVQRLERHFPELEQRLLTASQIQLGATARPAGYLQRCVISEAIRHDVRHGWYSLVSSWRIALARLVNIAALLCLLATAWVLWKMPVSPMLASALSNTANRGALATPLVEPGDTEIERGSSLIVTARFDQQVPAEVWLVHSRDVDSGNSSSTQNSLNAPAGGNGSEVRLRMRPSLDDPIFAAYLVDVNEPLSYRVEYGAASTPAYHVDVFEVPALVRSDADLVFPDYTQQPPRTVLDTRRITVAAGTQVTWKLLLNKPVTIAELIPMDGDPIPLLATKDAPAIVQTSQVLLENQQWQVRLVDSVGRSNAIEIQLRATVLPNEPAKIKLLAGGDARVSPIEEFDVSAKVSDDFSVMAAGIGYQFGGSQLVELTAIELEVDSTQATFSHRIDLEKLAAEANQLLSYYIWADERGDDGSPRRTVSDMYFVEVRPFEEIFREGEPPPAGQQQQQQQQASNPQTEELLELQKQIVIATWNLLRDAPQTQLPERMVSDLDLLVESQASAVELLEEKAAEEQAEELKPVIERANQEMQSAITDLTASRQSLTKSTLSQALSHEQAAYQALMQLQSQEYEVVRNQRSQSQSSSSRSQSRQPQLDQLELSNEENRYEDERLAQSQEDAEQSELRQVISRLRELAARQEDFNQQLRELQAALQAAETPQQREELQRQLERLREQQQQMLADSDELSERMQSPDNQAMQETQQDMQQARDNMQRASEALQQDQPQQALAAGTRAEQQLKEMQDEVRRQAANQFQESMQDMQQQASELEQRQVELAQKLSGQSKAEEEVKPSAGLRGDEPKQQEAAEQLREQQANLQQLLKQMEDTVTESEEAEPLLAQRLYDSYRKTQQAKALERLQVTEQLIERNLQQPASELAQESAEDLSQLREEIDRAAEAVLGSEIESLRQALRKLDELSAALEQELPSDAGPTSQAGQTNPGEPTDPTPESEQANQSKPANQPSQTRQPGQTEQANQSGQPGESNEPRETGQPSQAGQAGQTGGTAESDGSRQEIQSDSRILPGLRSQSNQSSRPSGGPLTGDGFREWSDGLRDVEELVADAELRWQATEIRQAARDLRTEMKRQTAEPQWDVVRELVTTPLRELKRKVADELVRRAADKSQIVPLDRDPVPNEFSRGVRQYFENLGSGQ